MGKAVSMRSVLLHNGYLAKRGCYSSEKIIMKLILVVRIMNLLGDAVPPRVFTLPCPQYKLLETGFMSNSVRQSQLETLLCTSHW